MTTSAQAARAIADQAAIRAQMVIAQLNAEQSVESLPREMPNDRDARIARQAPFTVAGWDAGAA